MHVEITETIPVSELVIGDWIELVRAPTTGGDGEPHPCEVRQVERLEHSRVVVTVCYLQSQTFGGRNSPPHELWNTVNVWLWKFSRVVPTYLVLTPKRQGKPDVARAEAAVY